MSVVWNLPPFTAGFATMIGRVSSKTGGGVDCELDKKELKRVFELFILIFTNFLPSRRHSSISRHRWRVAREKREQERAREKENAKESKRAKERKSEREEALLGLPPNSPFFSEILIHRHTGDNALWDKG